VVLVVVLGVGFLAGCSADSEANRCATPADCLGGQLCQAGTCFDACIDDSDCGPNQRCAAGGLCIAAERCDSPDDCPDGTTCDDRVCRTQTPECSRDVDCPPNFECRDGACWPRGGLECITRDDCAPGESCVDNLCVGAEPSDAGVDAGASDGGRDTGPSDTGPSDTGRTDTGRADTGAGDTNEDPDTGGGEIACTFTSDCPDGQLCIDRVCRDPGAEPDTGGEDAGSCVDFDDACDTADDCCSGLCLDDDGIEENGGICSRACTTWASCNPPGVRNPWWCAEVEATRVCAPSDWDRACGSAAECLGGICLRVPGDSSCAWRCDRSSDCPPDAMCGLVPFDDGTSARVCTPIGGRCIDQNDCLSQTCLTPDGGGLGYCSSFCDGADPGACPSGWSCTAPDPTQPALTVCTLPGTK
jgi:hypothetical protein